MIIYGWKQYAQVLAVLHMMCGRCGNRSEHVLRKLTTKVTLFWIPLFPISRKHTLFCPACEAEERVPKEQALAMAAGGPQAGYPPQPGYGPPPGQPPFPAQQQVRPQQFPQPPQPAFVQSAPRPYPGPPQGRHQAPQGPPPGYPPPQFPPQQYPPHGYPPR